MDSLDKLAGIYILILTIKSFCVYLLTYDQLNSFGNLRWTCYGLERVNNFHISNK